MIPNFFLGAFARERARARAYFFPFSLILAALSERVTIREGQDCETHDFSLIFHHTNRDSRRRLLVQRDASREFVRQFARMQFAFLRDECSRNFRPLTERNDAIATSSLLLCRREGFLGEGFFACAVN